MIVAENPSAHSPHRGAQTRRWLTLGQASRMLGVDQSTLRRWTDAGKIRSFRTPGGHRRFAEADVEAIIAGHGSHPGSGRYGDLSGLAIARIRRHLHRGRGQQAVWYRGVDEIVDEKEKERLRLLGRRLVDLVSEYLDRRSRKADLLEEAKAIGVEYGQELARSGLPLGQALDAFTFFRKSIDETTRQAAQRSDLSAQETLEACQQVINLTDRVLFGIAQAYEEGWAKSAV
jgi:excisionase family DNA binding protein